MSLSPPKTVAIVGGGPGGLLTARLLAESCADLCRTTIFEASERLGGKLLTKTFAAAPVLYEAGVAELYDYSRLGHDPLRDLVERLGLKTAAMDGPGVILGDAILNTDSDIRRKLGPATLAAINAFHDGCEGLQATNDYYEGYWPADNRHPWSQKSFADVLDEIPDETARRYIATAVHTDVAAAPHATTALNGLKNVLMDNPRYLRLYSIVGGLDRIASVLAEQTAADIVLGAVVQSVGPTGDGRYRVQGRRGGEAFALDFDIVVLALPNTWLQGIDFESRQLRMAFERHLAHYDRPAHYLRVTGLFREPFWRPRVKGAYVMQDVFGGTCLYDEGARHPDGGYGVLGWLLAGTEAQALANLDDAEIIARVIDSLPKSLAHGRSMLIEAHVHRWLGSVNALPGAHPVDTMALRHRPAPDHHPNVYVVGDYLLDSTINAVYDSADFTTNMIQTSLRRDHYTISDGPLAQSSENQGALGRDYHDGYAGELTYEESFADYFCEIYTTDLIRTVWQAKPPYRLLDVGSANGVTIELFDKLGVEAWGIENSPHIHARTLPAWTHRNRFGDVRALPFADNAFDFVYDTCLCYLPEKDIDLAIGELFRVVRKGVFFGGITTDMTREVIERHELFHGVQTFGTAAEWGDRFVKNGFRLAISDEKILNRVWKIECSSNEGDFPWYPTARVMRNCFFTKPAAAVTSLAAHPLAKFAETVVHDRR